MILLLIILYCISTFSLTSTLLQYTQPFFLLSSRMIISGILLLLYACARNAIQLDKKHLSLFVHAAIFAIFLPYALRYYGLLYASAPRSYLLYNLGPIITYLLTHFFGIEKITWQRSTTITVSFIGLLLMLNQPLTHVMSTPWGLPELALILSITSFCYGWIAIRTLIIHLNYHPALINGITMLGGGMLSLGATVTLETSPYITNISGFIALLPIVIVVSNLMGHTLYAYLLNYYSLTLLQLGYWLIPAGSALGHMFYEHTIPDIYTLSAITLLFTGFVLAYQQEKTHSAIKVSISKAH